jgi:hypothetical protein
MSGWILILGGIAKVSNRSLAGRAHAAGVEHLENVLDLYFREARR